MEITHAPTALERILRQTREALSERKRTVSEEELREAVAALAPDSSPGGRFRAALGCEGVSVIAEFKRRSPSAGPLRAGAEIRETLAAYVRGGASAVSVLTEEANFEGSLADLRAARAACKLPLLRKDFVLDPYQLYEARLAGADAILLIVAALEDERLATLHEQALALGLDALVEVHDAEELERAAAIEPQLVGVNNRDLRDFSVEVERTFRLLDRVPEGALVVSESGIGSREQVAALERAGVSAVLIGESLMRAPDPATALAALL
jgi:indole-3-glycerol phosphate synthase